MRNKKGFTLIELLAVIVILAVIALIATPIIMNVINDAKKGAAKDSTYGYVKAVELASTQYIVKNSQSLSGDYTTKGGNLYSGSTKVLDVTVSGTKPADNGSVTLNKGEVTKAELTVDGFSVKYDGDKATIGDEDSTNPTPKPTEEPSESKSFTTDSWDTIAKAVKSGNTSNYHVGDTKEITLTGEVAGTYTVRIANMSNDDSVCSNSNYSKTACGFVVEFADIITEHIIHSGSSDDTVGSAGGWPASEMRTYVNSTIYNALPSELKSVIIDTKVVSGHGFDEEENFISTDKLYLLSPKEVWNIGPASRTVNKEEQQFDYYKPDNTDSVFETRQLDYYKLKGVTEMNGAEVIKNNASGTASDWWLRSASPNVPFVYFAVHPSGMGTIFNPNVLSGVSPAFRIG